ncbi:MAG TPA: agmatine deiminase family protein [Acidobacteriota bacterium]|nr:agmatine deiminase family protein [Acidobacteriota bacterium]
MSGRETPPSRLGYAMPAEWSRHKATWLSYPSNPVTFARLEPVRESYHQMMAALLPHEEVHLLIDESSVEQKVRSRLPREVPQENLICRLLPTADVWIRDYGPNFLVRRQQAPRLAYNDWIFNAWGNKYDDLLPDNSVPRRLQTSLRVPCFTPGIVMEGGSIEVDGAGTCLTTEQCLLNPNRNPHLQRREIEQCLKDFLGLSRILWLGEGIAGDDTDGHIDDIARFASPDTIVCALEEDPRDENYAPLRDNLKRLRSFRRPDGQPYTIVTLPMPQALREEEGTRLPASYANFYIANRVVLMPSFGDPRDRQAKKVLEDLFPDRRVVDIDCRQLVRGLGTLHCVTQQQPLA